MAGLCKGDNEPPDSLESQSDDMSNENVYVKQLKGLRMNCDVAEATEGFENEL